MGGFADITMSAAKPRLTKAAKAAIFAKRMSEALTRFVISPRKERASGQPVPAAI
jgi:hypothetical protein